MSRLPNYRSRLFSVIGKYEREKFVYGKTDCAMFAASCIEAITGTDPAAAFRGKYTTVIGGMRKLKTHTGFTDRQEWISSMGNSVQPAFAQVGDIAIINNPDGDEDGYSLGVVGGSFVLAMGLNGLVRLPLSCMIGTYRIG